MNLRRASKAPAAVLLALCLHLQERDERGHLLLHVLEADQPVELLMEIGKAPRGFRAPKVLHLVGDPVGGRIARSRLSEPLAEHPDQIDWSLAHADASLAQQHRRVAQAPGLRPRRA